MPASAIGFVGGGRVTRALLAGWRRAGRFPAEVVVFDPSVEAVSRVQGMFPTARTTTDDYWLMSQMECVVVATHPPALPAAIAGLAGALRDDAVVLSLAPKVTLRRLTELLGGFRRVARCVPNAASWVGAGFNPVAFGDDLPQDGQHAVRELLAPLGECPVTPESQLEAFAVLTAMGPTCFWFQFQKLRELGQAFGLPSPAIDAGLKAALVGAARVFFESELTAAEVQDLTPIHPLREDEPTIREIYHQRLTDMYQRLRT